MNAAQHRVESPCNDVCTIDERTGWCLGCFRTLAEIGAWSTLDDTARRDVIADLALRRAAARELRRSAGGER